MCLCECYRRRLRIWEPVQPGVRYEHGGAEHGAVQRRAELRVVLRDPVRERRQVVPAGVHRRDCHQLLPAQQRSPEQRRRLVQSSPPPLRPLPARFPAHRPVPRRHRPRRLSQVQLITSTLSGNSLSSELNLKKKKHGEMIYKFSFFCGDKD